MGFSLQWDFIRAFLVRIQKLSRRRGKQGGGGGGCTGRIILRSRSSIRRRRGVLTEDSNSEDEWTECGGGENGRRRRQGRRRRRRRKRHGGGDPEEIWVKSDGLPSQEAAYAAFVEAHPAYLDTMVVDDIREDEYSVNAITSCFTYSGYGLFSQLQQDLDLASSSFTVEPLRPTPPLTAAAAAATAGTVESDIRRRISRFLNLPESDYTLVFTATRSAAFQLLSATYPFSASPFLLHLYDYHSHAFASMTKIAAKKNANLLHPSFKWPSLNPSATHLKSQLLQSSPPVSDTANFDHKGLFVFPAQSRVTGTKYSYQWISVAQEQHWHVLLDASALGPKDMDSLALSLFQPDFIITSFYKVFGSDPSGFGCLFIKNSVISSLQQESNSPPSGAGIVRLVPLPDMSPLNNFSENLGDNEQESLEIRELDDRTVLGTSSGKRKNVGGDVEIAFSAPIASCNRPNHSQASNTCSRTQNSRKIGTDDHGPHSLCDMESVKEEDPYQQQDLEIVRHGDHVRVRTEKDKHAQQDVNSGEIGRSTRELAKRELGKGKMALTPRSVLEESLNDGESVELMEGAGYGGKQKQSTPKFFEPGEASCAQTTAPQKKSILGYHSYEIGRNAFGLDTAGAFSQPLISHDAKRDFSLVHSDGSSYYAGSQEDLGFSSSLYDEDEESSEFGMPDEDSLNRREPEIFCRGLNHADTLGLNKTNDRLRFLTNWLTSSLLKLQHLNSNKCVPLVHIYGPKVKYDRGASLAFNLFDRNGGLIRPTLVQQLAERHNISLGTALLYHIQFPENCPNLERLLESMQENTDEELSLKGILGEGGKAPRFAVVTAALGFVTNFEDVYGLWVFVAKFLDAEFVLNEF